MCNEVRFCYIRKSKRRHPQTSKKFNYRLPQSRERNDRRLGISHDNSYNSALYPTLRYRLYGVNDNLTSIEVNADVSFKRISASGCMPKVKGEN